MEHIKKYFSNLTTTQLTQLEQLGPFYKEWNSKINVVSRKDIDNIYQHHILHALSIAKVIQFKPFTNILDIGTGGGLPGIPLAILFPDSQFHLIDSVGKKIKVVQAAVDALGLKNVKAEHKRAQEVKTDYDFVVSRAVTKLTTLYEWTRLAIPKKTELYNSLPNGLLVLKGGDLANEISSVKPKVNVFPVKKYYAGMEYYAEKFVLHVKV